MIAESEEVVKAIHDRLQKQKEQQYIQEKLNADKELGERLKIMRQQNLTENLKRERDKSALAKKSQTQKPRASQAMHKNSRFIRMNTRKYGYCADEMHKNLILIFGCAASKTVKAETGMVYEIAEAFNTRFSTEDLTLQIPGVFENLTSREEKLEMSISNTVQPLKLFYEHQVVSDSIAFVFVNTESKGLIYRNAEKRGEEARKLFEEVLEFKRVEVLRNYSKQEVIAKLNSLKDAKKEFLKAKAEAEHTAKVVFKMLDTDCDGTIERDQVMNFTRLVQHKTLQIRRQSSVEQAFQKIDFNDDKKVSYDEIVEQGMNQRVEENLVIGIAWIGHTLDPHYNPHKKIIDDAVTYQETESDDSDYMGEQTKIYPWYELTYLGEPICLNEQLCQFSNDENVHILLLDDYQSDLGMKITRENVHTKKIEQALCPKMDRQGRERIIFIRQCNVDQVKSFLQNRKEIKSKVFCLPQNLEQLGIIRHIWDSVENQDQMIIDLRTEEEKKSWRKCREPYTFKKTNCNVWQDRPQLINRECVLPKNWRPSVHHIEKQDVIMLVALDERPTRIVLIFYDTKDFYEIQRIQVQRFKFDCAMIVNEIQMLSVSSVVL